MKKGLSIVFFSVFLFVGCKTYTISTESFKNQMMSADAESMKETSVNNPLFFNIHNIKYKSNDIKYINVIDKAGNKVILENKPSIEMKVKMKNGKSFIYYFDTVYLENDSLKGSGSRFISFNRAISLDDIEQIYIQDGKKNFRTKN